jgi:hypothetical protein
MNNEYPKWITDFEGRKRIVPDEVLEKYFTTIPADRLKPIEKPEVDRLEPMALESSPAVLETPKVAEIHDPLA